MELFLLYVWLKLDIIIGLLIAITICSVMAALAMFLWTGDGDTSYERHDRKVWYKGVFKKKLVPLFFSCLLASLMIPDRMQVAVLVGGHYAFKMADTPEAGKVMQLLRKKANEMLDEQLSKAK